ncbi:MAG: hypothetical protein L0J17_06165 [Brevibacterium sp.]|uniref:hypothetical protein n=1 Tax=Brevibacterium sp. TaxID=1701 RepID=UPI002648EAFD|nr:hypothetical protein [Brevibacterium sp.]MDN5805756.1 hypothetical protein [Brevibacterium sp.]MDN5834176.1 hypothetical protein [Brevibacterium sp.]MDN5876184.1 hypothetical protein [Brevibacterium sp.]MDN5909221.1 hypothetical protein [Brevibacterium sp.]MDN6133574.1 hypothetical protein [Brevibacterium sp.]
MSNGNDEPNFPPPPKHPPENNRTGSGAKTSADNTTDDSVDTSSAGPQTPASGSEQAPSDQNDQAPPFSPNDQASSNQPPQPRQGNQPEQYQPPRPEVSQASSNQAPPHNGGQHQCGPPSSGPQQPGQYQGGGPYPGGPYQSGPAQNSPYQSAQSGPYQTGSGPNAHRTGSGPGQSQAIPQPAPAPGFAGPATTATRADARPEKKKSRTPLFIALGAVALVIVLVLVGFLVVNTFNKNNYGPDKVAEDYVSALSKGDFAAAEKIAPSPRPEGTNLDLLSKEFTEPSSAKVENAKVESSKVDDDKGTVVVSYDLDGTKYNVELKAKKDGKQDLFFDKWTLTGPALNVISLDIPATDALSVNGKDYKAKAGTTSFAVYPGNYEFTIPKSKWVSEAKDTAAVNFPQAFAPGDKPSNDKASPLTLNLDLAPTSAFQKEVQKQVEKELKKCFDNKDIKPKCKFIKFDPTEIPVGGSDKKLADLAKKNTAKWDMKDMPKVKADFGAGDTNTGSFFTKEPGKFDFTVQGKKSGSSYFSNGNTLSVSGSVKIDGDKLSVEFFDF